MTWYKKNEAQICLKPVICTLENLKFLKSQERTLAITISKPYVFLSLYLCLFFFVPSLFLSFLYSIFLSSSFCLASSQIIFPFLSCRLLSTERVFPPFPKQHRKTGLGYTLRLFTILVSIPCKRRDETNFLPSLFHAF